MKIRPSSAASHSGSDEGWAVISTMLAGFVVWGGVGWLLDQWWGTRLATPIGLIVGMALGIYAVVARVSHADPVATRLSDQQPDPLPGPPPAGTRRETE